MCMGLTGDAHSHSLTQSAACVGCFPPGSRTQRSGRCADYPSHLLFVVVSVVWLVRILKIACHSQRCEASIFSATQAANHRDASSARSLEKAMPSLTGGRVRPSLRHARSTGEWRGSAKTRIKFFCCCFPIRESRPTSAAAAAEHAQKDSLLEKYGIDELSDTDGESELPENPMSPEQIARMRTCSSQQHGISSPADIMR